MTPRRRSKTVATWLAFVFGALGAHRWYLHGSRDALGWLHLPLTAAGLVGVLRLRAYGEDDRVAWVLLPLLGLVLAQSMLCAIVYGLAPDERWAAHWQQPVVATRWAPVLGVVGALLVGSAVLLSSIAFAIQKAFEA